MNQKNLQITVTVQGVGKTVLDDSSTVHTVSSGGSRIFPGGGRQLPKRVREPIFLVENCMKMKEFWPPGGARVPGAPP